MIAGRIQGCLASLTSQVTRYRATAIILALLCSAIIGDAIRTRQRAHALAYLSAMLLCAIIVDMIAATRPRAAWVVNDKAHETRAIVFSLAMTVALSTLRFVVIADMRHLNPFMRVALFVLVLLFVYPLFLLAYFIWRQRYSPRQLGLRVSAAWVALPVIAIIGVTTCLVAPQKLQFREVYEQSGVLSMLFLGFVTAALPEEFVRVLAQSRFSAVFANKGLGWLAASVLWAVIHIPNFYSRSGSLFAATMSTIGIVPIGLLWGYMSERLKSIAPSVLTHGTNLWGLQNLL